MTSLEALLKSMMEGTGRTPFGCAAPMPSLTSSPLVLRLAADERAFHHATTGDLRAMVQVAGAAIAEGQAEATCYKDRDGTELQLNLCAMSLVRETLLLELFPEAIATHDRPAVWHTARKMCLEHFRNLYGDRLRDAVRGLEWFKSADRAAALDALPRTPAEADGSILAFLEGYASVLASVQPSGDFDPRSVPAPDRAGVISKSRAASADGPAIGNAEELTGGYKDLGAAREAWPDGPHLKAMPAHLAQWHQWGRIVGRAVAREREAARELEDARLG